MLVWSSYTDLKFFYMQHKHIFVCLLLCVLGFLFLFGAVLVCLINLFILALNLIYPDENLKSMCAFLILIALFFPLVSIRCKLYIINKRQNLFTVHCTCILNIQLSITPTVHHHYYLMLFRISFCVKWRLWGWGDGTLLFFMFCLQEEILFLSIQGINNNDDRNWSNLHYVRKKKRPSIADSA